MFFLVHVSNEYQWYACISFFKWKFNMSFSINFFCILIWSSSFCLPFAYFPIQTLIRHANFWGFCVSLHMATTMCKSSIIDILINSGWYPYFNFISVTVWSCLSKFVETEKYLAYYSTSKISMLSVHANSVSSLGLMII